MSDEIEESRDRVIPMFHMQAVQNRYRTKVEGRPIYEDKEYVQILIPGNKCDIIDRPVQDKDIERWPEQYRRFKERKEQAVEGTPLEAWPEMTPARIAALKDAHVQTVDQLANLPDSAKSTIGPDFHMLKQKAKRFLEGAEASSLQEQIEVLQQQIRVLQEENRDLAANQRKRPGRKPQQETIES